MLGMRQRESSSALCAQTGGLSRGSGIWGDGGELVLSSLFVSASPPGQVDGVHFVWSPVTAFLRFNVSELEKGDEPKRDPYYGRK